MTATTREDLPLAAEPVVNARQLSLRTKRGWVFRDVDLDLAEGELLAVAGPAGSGRSMLLLTLAGRAKPSSGTLSVAGDQRRSRIRQATLAARITGAIELEGDLRIADHLREAQWLTHRELDYRSAAELVGFTVDSATFVNDLAPDEATLFAVALAVAGKPRLVVVDDVDVAATVEQQRRIWAALAGVARSGITVAASTVEPDIPAALGARVLALPVHGEYNDIPRDIPRDIPSEIPGTAKEDGSDATD
ncbi:MAG TPA: ATP-binding cassette domain-containing protein [Pseudonocardiaceae bacterium]|jgi:ABC-type multidrug transport system ATPase subunit|nr:ATP-binding cassette domain-containing protein [Pseudonocardiaceae bacterium]